jgi:hypothetical protein
MIIISGVARLYEGTDCGTDDLEVEREFAILVLPNQSQPLNVDLNDSSGSAAIRLTVGNLAG